MSYECPHHNPPLALSTADELFSHMVESDHFTKESAKAFVEATHKDQKVSADAYEKEIPK